MDDRMLQSNFNRVGQNSEGTEAKLSRYAKSIVVPILLSQEQKLGGVVI